jgi:hypothetical protein
VISISALLLIVCVIGNYLTRDSMANFHFTAGQGGRSPEGLVDQSPWNTAAALAPLAVSAEEQRYAREAPRLADHEVGQTTPD